MPLPYAQPLSPQTTGDLIGRAIRTYRSNLIPWARLLLWPTIGVLVGRVIIQLAGYFASESNATDDLARSAPFFACLLGGLVIVFVFKWLLLTRQLALVRLSTGFSNNFDDAFNFIKSRQLTMFGTIVVCVFMILAVGMLWALELIFFAILLKWSMIAAIGIAVGAAGLIISELFIYFTLYLSLASLACDENADSSRGFNIANKSRFRTLFAGALITLTVFLLAIPMSSPAFIFIVIDSLRLGPASGTHHPYYWQVVLAAWETLVEMLTSPLIFLSYGFYYYDLRLRFEGVDVLEQLNQFKLEKNLELSDRPA